MADTFKGIITADGKKRQLPYGAVLDRPVSDTTFSKEGGFADSKAVGNKFAKVDSETASLKEDFNNGSYAIRYDNRKITDNKEHEESITKNATLGQNQTINFVVTPSTKYLVCIKGTPVKLGVLNKSYTWETSAIDPKQYDGGNCFEYTTTDNSYRFALNYTETKEYTNTIMIFDVTNVNYSEQDLNSLFENLALFYQDIADANTVTELDKKINSVIFLPSDYYPRLEWTAGNISSGTGENIDSELHLRSNALPVEVGQTYRFDKVVTAVLPFSADNTYLKPLTGYSVTEYTVPTSDNPVAYLRFANAKTRCPFTILMDNDWARINPKSVQGVVIDKAKVSYGKWYGKKAWFCGDSITDYGYYPPRLSISLGLSGYKQDGHSGANIGGCIKTLLSDLSVLNGYDLITLFAGTNDFGGNTELGNITDSFDSDTTCGKLHLFIKSILGEYPNIRIVGITPLPRGKFGTQVGYGEANATGKTLSDYVKAIKGVYELYHIPFVNLYDIIGWNEYNISEKTSDNLHPTKDITYNEIVPLLTAQLNAL